MPTSARRLGLDVIDLELELRLRRIETELENRVRTTDLSDGDTIRTNDIPTVTGLRVSGSTAGAITIAWTAVPISDLKRYEIDIAEDLGFSTNLVTSFVAGTEFNYTTNSDTGGGGGTDVFVRVRARAQSGNVGLYSVTLNATTGQAQVNDIADDAVTNDAIADGAITSDKVDSDDPIKFTGLDDADVGAKLALAGFIAPRGFHMSNATIDTTRDAITVTAGVARGEQNNGSIDLSSATTKDITNTFALGTGNGGFPTTALTLTDGVDYRVFAIDKIDSTQADVGYDTSVTAANLIAEAVLVDAGYVGALYRQLGWITYTSAAAGIRPFYSPVREPEKVFWESGTSVSMTESSGSSTLHTFDAPINTTAIFNLLIRQPDDVGQDTRHFWIKSTAIADAPASSSNYTHRMKEESETDQDYNWAYNEVELDSSSQCHCRFGAVDGAEGAYFVNGFIFHR